VVVCDRSVCHCSIYSFFDAHWNASLRLPHLLSQLHSHASESDINMYKLCNNSTRATATLLAYTARL